MDQIYKTSLPNGLEAYEKPKNTAQMIYNQIQDYFMSDINNILLRRDLTVVDIGANIGLFSMEVIKRANGQAHVYCFEPMPDTFKLLELNLGQFNSPNIHLFKYGLGEKEDTITFMYRPLVPTTSSRYDIEESDKNAFLNMIYNEKIAEKFHVKVPNIIKYIPRFMTYWLVTLAFYAFNKTKGKAIPVECKISTLSKFISDKKITKIDLLKIDVEKSEIDVLSGISATDWGIINSIVLEIHDIEDRRDTITKILTHYGFNNIYVDKQHEEETVYNIFGYKAKSPRAQGGRRFQEGCC
jgi:FkbM family methyltransferase